MHHHHNHPGAERGHHRFGGGRRHRHDACGDQGRAYFEDETFERDMCDDEAEGWDGFEPERRARGAGRGDARRPDDRQDFGDWEAEGGRHGRHGHPFGHEFGRGGGHGHGHDGPHGGPRDALHGAPRGGPRGGFGGGPRGGPRGGFGGFGGDPRGGPDGGFGGGHGSHGGGRGRGGRIFDQGDLRLVILTLIRDEPRHGYDLIKAIEEKLAGAYVPSPGVVYPNLSMLEEMGHASIEERDGRKLYAITDEGRTYLEAHETLVKTIFARMEKVAAAQPSRSAPEVLRAFENLKMALSLRRERGALSKEESQAIAAILDEAARAIEQS
ncbi:PadR family transcriptional regulator [Afifella sp. YEN Y35]|uniref:PadR family transcriptional regulator n=1 Tax=Afifella sp. YEN Y35 TaxID=3388337 RepID=UPI0039DF6D82